MIRRMMQTAVTNRYLRRTLVLGAALLTTGALLGGCKMKVPTQDSNVVNVNPDFNVPDKAELDFTDLHNETMELFNEENAEPYMFVRNVDISGSNKTKTITVRAEAVEDSTTGDAEHFAAALLAYIADAATNQYSPYEQSSPKSFGGVYKDYAVDFVVKAGEQEILNLQVPAGGEIPLDPDHEKYEEAWARDLELYNENVVYGPDGKPVYDPTAK